MHVGVRCPLRPLVLDLELAVVMWVNVLRVNDSAILGSFRDDVDGYRIDWTVVALVLAELLLPMA